MDETTPMVTIGMPVYNGEPYLAVALDSMLAQTFADIEIVLSNNASTDGTAAICEAYAAKDPRIRYFQQPTNIGAGPNYNFVFDKAAGRYFKWASHDDFCSREFLERCVAALEANPEAVLCYPYFENVDENGEHIADVRRSKGRASQPHNRMWDLMLLDYSCEEIFGLIRYTTLKRTQLIRSYTDSDRTLLGELALHGPFLRIEENLFFHRVHAGMSTQAFDQFNARTAWFDPGLEGKIVMPHWLQVFGLLRAIRRAPIEFRPKLRCYVTMLRFMKWRSKMLFRELIWGSKQLWVRS